MEKANPLEYLNSHYEQFQTTVLLTSKIELKSETELSTDQI